MWSAVIKKSEKFKRDLRSYMRNIFSKCMTNLFLNFVQISGKKLFIHQFHLNVWGTISLILLNNLPIREPQFYIVFVYILIANLNFSRILMREISWGRFKSTGGHGGQDRHHSSGFVRYRSL